MTSRKGAGAGGRPKRLLLDLMRTRAWVCYLKQRLDIRTDNALGERLGAELNLSLRFDRYMNGVDFPSESRRNLIGQYPGLARSATVYEIGPAVGDEIVPFWLLFEEQFDEFGAVIDLGLSYGGKHSPTGDRIAQVGHLFLAPQQWTAIRAQQEFKLQSSNPVQRASDLGEFAPDMRTLAATIACWRLCMHVGESVAPVEYLLHCLLAGPCRPLLRAYLIEDEVAGLVKALAVEYHAMQGNIAAAAAAFSGLLPTAM